MKIIDRKLIHKFISGLLILGSLIILFATQAEAASIYNGSPTYYNSSSSVPTEQCEQSVCPQNPEPFCYNSQAVGVTDCGFACQKGDLWSRYTYSGCVVEPGTLPPPGYDEVCTDAYARNANTCSTGDKYNSSNRPVMNAGFCSCQAGGPYKTCCSNGSQVNARNFQVDPYNPDEADCGGATTVRCGEPGQPACGQAACATPTPAPTPAPTPTPNPLCPGSGVPSSGWGGSCSPGSVQYPPCGACGTCSVASCSQYAPNVYCWFNSGTCYNDPALCPNKCGGQCTTGTTQTICYPNESTKTCNR